MERSLVRVGEDVHSIVEWDESALYRTLDELQVEAHDNSSPRQKTEASRLLGHVAFELHARENIDKKAA